MSVAAASLTDVTVTRSGKTIVDEVTLRIGEGERWAVLGAPMFGVMCLCFAAFVLPLVGIYLGLVTLPLAALSFVLFLWAMMYFIPLPDLFYPRWARPLRERNRRVEAAWKQEFRRRRGR